MALDDTDRAEIAQLIASASRQPNPPARTTREPPVRQSDWDAMGERDRQAYVRDLVEEHVRSLDEKVDRENLLRENEQLRAEKAEWEKAGRKGPKPTRGGSDKPAAEQTPTIVSKAYTFLFGSATQ